MAGTIAFIGCGAMGAPMAERLIDGGFALRIFDVNKEAMRSLVERGAVAADPPREAAAGADTAFACLPSPEVASTWHSAPTGLRDAKDSPSMWKCRRSVPARSK